MAFLIPENAKSRSDIPAGIRRVISAFQVGLDGECTVWYEPLYDPSGEKPHLVLLLPDAGVAVLEVLDTRQDRILGLVRGRLRLVRDEREVEVASPLERAERLAKVLVERITAEQRLRGVGVPVVSGAVFPNLELTKGREAGLDRVLPPDRCLYKEHLEAALAGTGETELLRAFRRMLGQPLTERLASDHETVLRGLIQPETVIGAVAAHSHGEQLVIFRPPDDGEDAIRVMDRQQEAMAKSLGDGHRVIRGVAGSGKTLVLVYRAKLLARLMPREKFLLTCYTRSLAGQLRTMVSDYPNLRVVHLDRLMAEFIRDARMKHPGYKDDDQGEKVAEAALQALGQVTQPRYRAVLVDEAQDFGTNALRFALGLLEGGSEDLIIVADAAQNIFRRKFSWKQAGIKAQGRTQILRKNYRNTRQILEFASRFLLASRVLRPDDVPDPEDEHAVIPPEAAIRTGPAPILTVERSVDDEVNHAVEQVRSWARNGGSPRSVAVLYGATMDTGVDRARRLYETLRQKGVGVFWMNDPADKNAKDRISETREPVVLSTIQSAKGLEFPFVVLCGLWRDGDDAESNRKLAYVGMTRATAKLAVVTRQGHPLVADLQQACA